ncbi:MAG: phosphoglycerate kinase [bacterium]|nr:phosphoglycerate kinase [bacterium]
MALIPFSIKKSLHGTRILIRVDWNVPTHEKIIDTEALKFQRTLPFIDALSKKGAIVILMTHLGRPKRRDPNYSTKRIADAIQKREGIPMDYIDSHLESERGTLSVQKRIADAKPGDIFVLENVRFQRGEEKNSTTLAKRYASFADVFINDAFASCHRAHASVVGVTKYLPSFAGPSLLTEVHALERILHKPKKPFYAVVGGAKLMTKIGVLQSLLRCADRVYVGGALAHPFYQAMGHGIGKSIVEKRAVSIAKKMLKKKNIIIPMDALVASSISNKTNPKNKILDEIESRDVIGDIGIETMKKWSQELQKANTIVWNGPVGAVEFEPFSHGTNLIAHAIARRSKTKAVFGVVGGGDTIPVLHTLQLEKEIDHISTGGGAMLEFIASRGKLPGLQALQKKKNT